MSVPREMPSRRAACVWLPPHSSSARRIRSRSEIAPGVGFDSDAIPADRQGIALSIKARMTQFGGEAFINTSVGAGTEVQLIMPRNG